MKKRMLFGVMAICLWAGSAVAAPPGVDAIVKSPQFKAAAAAMDADHDQMVEETIKITEIPAPPFKEEARGLAYAQMMRESGLKEVSIDGIGNVIGVRPGADRRLPAVIVAAHLDTVFPEGTDVKVRRDGTKLSAPGIGDDTRPLAVLLAFVRAMDKAGVRTERDLIFVGDVGEEGLGDLRGVKYLFANNPRAKTAFAFITMEVTGFAIQTTAVGSKRYRVTFTGPGGHSSEHFGIVNPLVPLASVITRMYEMKAPTTARTTYAATVVGGGSGVNAIPGEAFLMVDMRSADVSILARMEEDFRTIVREAVEQENKVRDVGNGRISAEIKMIGDRPAGRTDEKSPLVRNAFTAAARFGYEPRGHAYSSDANLPMSLGIPAISIGSGASGGRQHSLEEYIDVAKPDSLRGMNAGLVTIVATAGYLPR